MYDKVSELSKILDELKTKKGFTSEKELAEFLNVKHPLICAYRSGEKQMCNEKCLKIAIGLGVEPDYVISAADSDRAKRKGKESLWQVFRKAKANLSAIVFAILAVTSLVKSADNQKAVRLF